MGEMAAGEKSAGEDDRVHLRAPASRDGQAFVDGFDGDARAIALDPGHPFQRDGGNQPILVEQTSRSVMSAGMGAENQHEG